jgi:peptide deformylase
MELLKESDKLLRRKAKRVDKIDDKIRNIAANMVELMKEKGGIGLAGNQVGILKQIIVVLVKGEPKVMINPEIIFTSEEEVGFVEGCLSFPSQYHNILRPKSVTVKYRNLSGHPMLETHDGLVARVIQHEIDHLNGIVFTEKLNETHS